MFPAPPATSVLSRGYALDAEHPASGFKSPFQFQMSGYYRVRVLHIQLQLRLLSQLQVNGINSELFREKIGENNSDNTPPHTSQNLPLYIRPFFSFIQIQLWTTSYCGTNLTPPPELSLCGVLTSGKPNRTLHQKDTQYIPSLPLGGLSIYHLR